MALTLTLASGCTNITVQVEPATPSGIEITLGAGVNTQVGGPNIPASVPIRPTDPPSAQTPLYSDLAQPFNLSNAWFVAVNNAALPATFSLKITKSKSYQGELETGRFITEFNCDFDIIKLSYSSSSTLNEIKTIEVAKIPFTGNVYQCLVIVYAANNLVRPILVRQVSFNGKR
jgi:hypothetical protein